MTSPGKGGTSEYRQRQKNWITRKGKHKAERKVKTVARQHTTYRRIWQGIQFLRFRSPGLLWKYNISSTSAVPSFKNHKGVQSASTPHCFLPAGTHTLKLGWRYYQAHHTCFWKVLGLPGFYSIGLRVEFLQRENERIQHSNCTISTAWRLLKCLQVVNSLIVPEIGQMEHKRQGKISQFARNFLHWFFPQGCCIW